MPHWSLSLSHSHLPPSIPRKVPSEASLSYLRTTLPTANVFHYLPFMPNVTHGFTSRFSDSLTVPSSVVTLDLATDHRYPARFTPAPRFFSHFSSLRVELTLYSLALPLPSFGS